MNTPPDPQRLIAAHHAAASFYRARLPDAANALAYLHSRGIVATVVRNAPWTIGYAPRGWTALRDHLRRAGFTDRELLAAGLATTTRTGGIVDVFRDRVMFPIRDTAGNMVAFTGRDLSGRAGVPKYRNTTTTAIYHKKRLLYGLGEQLGAHRPDRPTVLLVEGPADVLAVARLRRSPTGTAPPGPLVAVAPCGTALTAEQVALLAGVVEPGTPVVVAFDADPAGRDAADAAYRLLRAWPGPVEAIALPPGRDPAAVVAAGPAHAAATFAHARIPLVDLVVAHTLARFRLDEVPGRLGAVHAVAPVLADIAATDLARAARLSADLAARLDLNPLTVFEAIFPPDTPRTTDPPEPGEEDHRHQPPAAADRPAAGAGAGGGDAIPLGGAGFPDPDTVAHHYARSCPATAAAATWVQHDPATGHSAWVIAEGLTATIADREATRLAAEIAGRVALLVGAEQAIAIARAAVNAHATQPGADARANASIAILTSFDGQQPRPGPGRFTLAWAGAIRAWAATGRWFAPLTTEPTTRAPTTPSSIPVATRTTPARASVRGGPIAVNRIDLPVTQILLAGRALATASPDQLQAAVQGRRPAAALGQVRRLGGPATLAITVRPRPDLARRNAAAVLARQDQPAAAVPAPRSPAQLREALPAAASTPQGRLASAPRAR